MAHHLVKKEKAFDLFVRGGSLKEIADSVKVSIATIQRWKKKEDWEARDAEIGMDLRRKLDHKRMHFKLSAYKELTPITEQTLGILKILLEKKTRFRSLEGGINAAMLLFITQNKLLGISEPGTHIKIENKAQAANISSFQLFTDKLFDALRKVFGPQFDLKRDELVQAIQSIVTNETPPP